MCKMDTANNTIGMHMHNSWGVVRSTIPITSVKIQPLSFECVRGWPYAHKYAHMYDSCREYVILWLGVLDSHVSWSGKVFHFSFVFDCYFQQQPSCALLETPPRLLQVSKFNHMNTCLMSKCLTALKIVTLTINAQALLKH